VFAFWAVNAAADRFGQRRTQSEPAT
jgi:hypothetical protein